MQSYRFESVLAHPSFDLWNPIGQVESRKRHVQRNQARFPQNHGFLYSIFSTWSTARQYTPIACISLFSDCQSTLITETTWKKNSARKRLISFHVENRSSWRVLRFCVVRARPKEGEYLYKQNARNASYLLIFLLSVKRTGQLTQFVLTNKVYSFHLLCVSIHRSID